MTTHYGYTPTRTACGRRITTAMKSTTNLVEVDCQRCMGTRRFIEESGGTAPAEADACMDVDPTVAATIDVRITVSVEMVDGLIEMAGYGIGYWARLANWEPGVSYYVLPADPDYAEKTLTYEQLAQALGQVAFNDVNVRSDLREYARSAVLEKDAGDIDAELADVVVQFAMFGEIIFG